MDNTKRPRSRTYDFITDPGHGWLKVSREECKRLGILTRITPFSYQRGGYVYLEEDCDAHLFTSAKRKAGERFKYRDRPCDRQYSRVRRYARFCPTLAESQEVGQ